ncbi:MAG: hypothetical protein KJ737_18180 [Proteobacteria bacterium]|nr:hypothetical protein [Pseudomonadota bacterium]
MQHFTKAQKARNAIRLIKVTADALVLRGYYKPSGQSGQKLAEGFKILSPEIYGSMNDPRIIELKGLEYVIERLPLGIEKCNRIILTAQEEFEDTSFEKILPPKRRRTSYKVSEKEICFVITRGLSEIYDILTHITFLNIEASKIHQQMRDREKNLTSQWKELEKILDNPSRLDEDELDHALWNLSIILGRTFHETKESYVYLEKYGNDKHGHGILFQIIHGLGRRMDAEKESRDNELLIAFTPSLNDMIASQIYGQIWASTLKKKIVELGLNDRPIHIISANMHSVRNLLYGYALYKSKKKKIPEGDIYTFIKEIVKNGEDVHAFSEKSGLNFIQDISGAYIDCQIIDTDKLKGIKFHPDLKIGISKTDDKKPVLVIMDYAFGTQAFEVMDELLDPEGIDNEIMDLNIESISIMGKAGILPGKKGDIMLATAHVFEGTSDNYPVTNDLSKADFQSNVAVYEGPIVTVIGTSLQNTDVLKRFQTSTWKAVGLEMEGGHYQKAISSAMIRGHIPGNVKLRYAYYASDNPLISGQTLASGGMGEEGIKPTYMITKVILEKILS